MLTFMIPLSRTEKTSQVEPLRRLQEGSRLSLRWFSQLRSIQPNGSGPKLRRDGESSLIDFSFHAGMMNLGNLPNIPEIAQLGVRSFKTFTCKPYYADDHTLMSLMRETAMHHSILNVHAEDEQIANDNLQKLLAEGRREPLAHAEWKPNVVEERAVKKVIEFARGIGARLHISHMSTHEGVDAVRKAKRQRVKVTTETCPHYLTFTRRGHEETGTISEDESVTQGPKGC